MSVSENKAFITEYLAALSGRPKSASQIDKYVADPSLKEHILFYEEAFPSYKLEIERMLAEDDLVAVHATFKGVHEHDLFGIPASNRSVTMSATIIYRIAGGKIVEHWLDADGVSMMQQIGAMPAMA
jgi:hypothetical protein